MATSQLVSTERRHMKNADIITALKAIDDPQLLSATPESLTQKAYKTLEGRSFDGFVLRAPTRVDFTKNSSVPILFVFSQSGARAGEVILDRNAVFVSNRLEDGELWIEPVFPPPAHKIPMAPDRQPDLPAGLTRPTGSAPSMPSRTTSAECIDLQARGIIPSEIGHYALRLIAHDWQSNTVVIEIDGASDPVAKPTTHTTEARRWAVEGPGQTDGLPSFVLGQNTPELDGKEIALKVEVDLNPALRVRAYGRVRRPYRPAYQVPDVKVSTKPDAVIPGLILLTRRDILNPIVHRVELPVYSGTSPKTGDLVEGYFAHDLNQLGTARLPSATYLAYFIVDEAIFGPVEFTVPAPKN